jgi:NTE family protein
MEISVALGGGGIKGIAHIGVLDALEKAGFKICAIAGTSAGGLIGSVYAAGYNPKEILSLIENISPNRLYARHSTDGPSLLGYAGLADTLIEVLGEMQFSELKIPFACTAVDIRTTQEIYLSQGRVLDAVLASIAIPGIFPSKISGEMELVDGGILDPVPVGLARCLNPRLPVVAVALNPDRKNWHTIPQLNFIPPASLPIPAPILEGFARMRIGQSLRLFLHSMDITARMLTEMRLEVDRPEVIVRPDVNAYGMLDVVDPKVLIAAGLRATEKAVPEIRKSLSWTNSIMRVLRSPHQQKKQPRKPETNLASSENGNKPLEDTALTQVKHLPEQIPPETKK